MMKERHQPFGFLEIGAYSLPGKRLVLRVVGLEGTCD